MSKLDEHQFRLDISVYPYSTAEMVTKGNKGTVHFLTEMSALSMQDAVSRLIGIYGACKWFSIGGRVSVNGVLQYVCLYSSEWGFSPWYHDCVNASISA